MRSLDVLRYLTVVLYLVAQIALGCSDSPVTDEPGSLRDGAAILDRGTVAVSAEHPPLVKLLCAAAIPAGERRAASEVSEQAGPDTFAADTRFAFRARLVGARLLRARLPAILIATAGLIAFGALFRAISPAAGLAATVLLGGSWPYLAHRHYATTDVAPVAFCILACWSLVRRSGSSGGILPGVFLAAAYAIGLLDQSHRSATDPGFDYWAGRLVWGARPLYPAATLVVKNDLPLLLLAAAGLLAVIRGRPFGAAAGIFGLAGLVYLILAGRSHLHYGVRHLLPLVALLAGLGAWRFERLRPAVLGPALLGAHVLAACLVFPHFVSAKSLVGRLWIGGERLYDVGDDWGQDLGRELRAVGGPVAYESLLVYRDPGWRALFPALAPEGSGCRRVIVDRLLLDLREASRRNPRVPSGAEAELALVRGWTSRLDRLEKAGERIPSPEPTYVVYRLGPAK